ncbi:MAG: hypothetical protein F6K30_20395 [Cyanothece sp. SIO2G6]|nr:hypothetical protein [Cyanothece sp. SIO2G6]
MFATPAIAEAQYYYEGAIQKIQSNNGKYKLVCENLLGLVLYEKGGSHFWGGWKPIWIPVGGTYDDDHLHSSRCIMQNDGNFVVYQHTDERNRYVHDFVYWASGTNNNDLIDSQLFLRDDGFLGVKLYYPNHAKTVRLNTYENNKVGETTLCLSDNRGVFNNCRMLQDW